MNNVTKFAGIVVERRDYSLDRTCAVCHQEVQPKVLFVTPLCGHSLHLQCFTENSDFKRQTYACQDCHVQWNFSHKPPPPSYIN